jgi:hypothetical protein
MFLFSPEAQKVKQNKNPGLSTRDNTRGRKLIPRRISSSTYRDWRRRGVEIHLIHATVGRRGGRVLVRRWLLLLLMMMMIASQ